MHNVFGGNEHESVHFPNAMMPQLVVLSKVLKIDSICAKKNVIQYSYMTQVLIHGSKVMKYIWTYTYKKWSLEETFFWISLVVGIVYV